MQRRLSLALALAAAGFLGAWSSAEAQDTTTGAAPAQADSGKRMGPAGFLLRQRAELGLSDDQVKKLEDLRTKYPAAENREAMRRARAERRAAWKEATAVLTDEQKEKLRETHRARREKWRAKHDTMHREHHRGMHPEPADSARGT